MIRGMGYNVLVADGPQAGMELARQHEIDLLVSDVVMPDMNGLSLRDNIIALRPGVRTLLMSGYSGDVISQYGDIGPETALLAKPFTAEALGANMRALLERK
jgi:two-component system cell cycle sensor histidine kinase/response regulator CckA